MPVPYRSHRLGDAPNVASHKSKLSPARQKLIDLLGAVHFGRIINLKVTAGEPVFDPAPTVVRTLKIAGKNGPRAEAAHPDFALRNAMLELLAHLDDLRDGVVNRIEIAHGLPLLLEVQGFTAA